MCLGLECGLDGLTCQFACGRQCRRLDFGEHLPVGCVGRRPFELAGHRQGLFENQSLKWSRRLKRARHDPASEAALVHYPGPDLPTTINYCTPFGCGDRFRWSVERVRKPHFTYVITAVNELVAPFHDRMPMILSPADFAKWFDANTTLADLHALLKPNWAELMVVSEASPFFKSPKNEGPRLLDLAA